MHPRPEDVLDQLAGELAAEGSAISGAVRRQLDARPSLGVLVAAGPRAAERPYEYAQVIECVREGYLLHYGTPRLLDPPDEDLALLAGDYLYAKGLERLSAIGDLESVGELADLISLSAQLHADGDPRRAAPILWLATTVAIAAGASPGYGRGKAALRRGKGAETLHAAASTIAADAGLDGRFAAAAETVGLSPSTLG